MIKKKVQFECFELKCIGALIFQIQIKINKWNPFSSTSTFQFYWDPYNWYQVGKSLGRLLAYGPYLKSHVFTFNSWWTISVFIWTYTCLYLKFYQSEPSFTQTYSGVQQNSWSRPSSQELLHHQTRNRKQTWIWGQAFLYEVYVCVDFGLPNTRPADYRVCILDIEVNLCLFNNLKMCLCFPPTMFEFKQNGDWFEYFQQNN